MNRLSIIFILANCLSCAFVGFALAEDGVVSNITAIKLLDKGTVSIEVTTTNNSTRPISFNPRIFGETSGDDGVHDLRANLRPGIYRVAVIVFAPPPEKGTAVVSQSWGGLLDETFDQSAIQLAPGESSKSSVKLDLTSMMGIKLPLALTKGTNIQVVVENWNAAATDIERRASETYRLGTDAADSTRLSFAPIKSKKE